MTDEQSLLAQMVLGKEALRLSLELLKDGSPGKVMLPYSLFDGDAPGSWKMTIERVR